MTTAATAWDRLDGASRLALELGWEAFQTGNIGVGAVVTDRAGSVVGAGRNRVADGEAPPGQVFGTSVAHAEINALATLPFRHPRELVLTTTLQPCLQCSAAIRMGPIALVRVIGADPLWDGCADLTSLNRWVARRPPIPVEGPMGDEVGTFATLLARSNPFPNEAVDAALRTEGEGALLDLADRLRVTDELVALAGLAVEVAMERLWPELVVVRSATLRSAATARTGDGDGAP